MPVSIRAATSADVTLIHSFVCALAEYEKLTHQVEATEEKLRATLFGEKPAAECLLAYVDENEAAAPVPAGFALFFANYSTFLAQPGLYLEDLFVKPEFRGRGVGKALLLHCTKLAIDFYESLGARRLREWQICRLTGESLARYR